MSATNERNNRKESSRLDNGRDQPLTPEDFLYIFLAIGLFIMGWLYAGVHHHH